MFTKELPTFFLVFIGGLIFSLYFYKISIEVARNYRLYDDPKSATHKIHKKPMPIAGGIAIIVMFTLFITIGNSFFAENTIVFLVPTIIIFLGGLIDDKKGLDAKSKLFWQILGASLLFFSGIHTNFLASVIREPLFESIIDYFITVFWLVAVTNSFNLVDSMDGLVVGISLITSIFLVIVTILSGQLYLSMLCMFLVSICLGALYYNISPPLLFLGDSGAQTLGFIFASILIVYTPIERNQASSWFVPILFLAVPIFDTGLVFISRIRKGLSFYKGDRNHTFHRLVKMGQSPSRAVLTMVFLSLIFNILGMLSLMMEPVIANVIFVSCIIVFVYIFWRLEFYISKA